MKGLSKVLINVDFETKRRLFFPIIDVIGGIRVKNDKEDYTDILLNGAVRIIELAGKCDARLLYTPLPIMAEESFQIVYFTLIFPSDEMANLFENLFETL